MRNILRGAAVAVALAGAIGIGATAAHAAPVSSATTGLAKAVSGDVTTVQYRGGSRGYRGGYRGGGRYYGGGRRYYRGGPGWGPGVAAGIIGLGIAGALAPRYYYDDPYYYRPRAYGPPVYYYPGW